MTKEEIKRTVSMNDVVSLYGIKVNRSGFCKCPFHSEKTASMKIYRDSYYCYGCSAHGDIFTFVQTIEHCNFKTAFQQLGGSYEQHKNESSRYTAKMRINARKSEQRIESLNESDEDKVYKLLRETIDECREIEEDSEPFSDEWCEAVKDLEYLDYLYDVMLFDRPQNRDIIDVYQQIRRIKQKRNTGA